MRIALIGQQKFGRAVLEAFIARGASVTAVFCPPEASSLDPLRQAAEERKLPVHQFAKLSDPGAAEALRQSKAQIGIMAYVTQFVPEAFCAIPDFGTIEFHPSLLPQHRGASSMGWAIIAGRKQTGLSIFRPTRGMDEGPVVLQRHVDIEPDDTLGSLYFDKIFPLGVATLVEAAEQVIAGKLKDQAQHEPDATYEGPIGEAESEIRWANHIDLTYNLIRGCNPTPGAWTTFDGRKLFVFDCRKRVARTFAEVKNKGIGEVLAVSSSGLTVTGPGGFIEISRVAWDNRKKIAAEDSGIVPGAVLGR